MADSENQRCAHDDMTLKEDVSKAMQGGKHAS